MAPVARTRIDTTRRRRRSTGPLLAWLLAAITAAWCAPAAASFIDRNDGSLCEVLAKESAGRLAKATQGWPAGTRFSLVSAQCRVNGSWVPRAYYFANTGDAVTPVRIPDATGRLDTAAAATVLRAMLEDPYLVGTSESQGSSLAPYHAFRYDIGSAAMLDLGTLAGPAGVSSAFGGTQDGGVVVGTSSTGPADSPGVTHAFRWTPVLGLQDLGAVYGPGASEAYGVSDDGTVLVGSTNTAFGVTQAFRWTLTNPATGAGTFAALGAATLRAYAISGDGSVIAGQGANRKAFRWTQAGGVTDLGTLPGHAQALAVATSADGQVLVGTSDPSFVSTSFPLFGPSYSSSARAFRWTQAGGLQDLNALMASAGVDMTGITLTSARGLSRDGKLIAGTGIFPGSPDETGYLIQYEDAANGAPATTAAFLEVGDPAAAAPGIVVSAQPAAGSVVAGQSLTTSVTVTSTGGYAGAVAMSCAGLPAHVTCRFSPASVSVAANGSTATTLTIATRDGAQASARGAWPALVSAALIGLVALPGAAATSRRRPVARGLLALLAALLVLANASCGGGGGGSEGSVAAGGGTTGADAAAGTYAISVSAAGSSGAQASTTFTLTVR